MRLRYPALRWRSPEADFKADLACGKLGPIMHSKSPEPPWEQNALRRALEAADPATLLLSLVQLTGERRWLDEARPHIRGPMNYQEFMPEELRAAPFATGSVKR
jgi:hypothetical protein